MRTLLAILSLFLAVRGTAQDLYFPPLVGSNWATVEPASLGWCPDALDSLYTLLDERGTKGFIILKDGRIAVERYFGTFTRDSVWYWASAGKSLTATLVGIAQEEGLLSIADPTQQYLGNGWTSLTPEQEAAITIRHQLTMTTGLNDGLGDVDCTTPDCLTYLAAPGTRWAYHNAPYTLLDPVLEAASGQTLNQFYNTRVGSKIGAFGLYVPIGFNRVFFSRTRDMARFGLLILANGRWNNTTVLGDMDYLTAMHTPSQTLNNSYGYLWWLNGQPSYMLPRVQFQFPGPLVPAAPADMFAALGKDDQKVYVVPSQGLVVVRLGLDAGESPLASSSFDGLLWQRISALPCVSSTTSAPATIDVRVGPNPTSGWLTLETTAPFDFWQLLDVQGRTLLHQPAHIRQMNTAGLKPGTYLLRINRDGQTIAIRKVVVQ